MVCAEWLVGDGITTSSLKKGKSNSFRLVVLVVQKDDFLVPITIFAKSTKENITPKELEEHLKKILFDLSQV